MLNMGPVVANLQSYGGSGTDGVRTSFFPCDLFASHTVYDVLRIILSKLYQRASAPLGTSTGNDVDKKKSNIQKCKKGQVRVKGQGQGQNRSNKKSYCLNCSLDK